MIKGTLFAAAIILGAAAPGGAQQNPPIRQGLVKPIWVTSLPQQAGRVYAMGLAPLFVEEIFRIIAELKAEGRTILLVEQNAQAALDIADHAYVLQSGRIELSGPAAEIARNEKVVAAYLGG